jgi:tetratricopeptide (TPR) repeat protein
VTQITADLENIRAAWIWATQHLRESLLQQATGGLALYFLRCNMLEEGPTRLFNAYERMVQDGRHSPLTLATLLSWASLLLSYDPATWRQGEEYAREALALLDDVDLPAKNGQSVRGWAHVALGNNVRHNPELAVKHFEISLAIFTGLGLSWEMGLVHSRLGVTLLTPADYRRVRDHYSQARDLAQSVGDHASSLFMKVELAKIDVYLGQLREAEEALREGIASLEEIGEAPRLAAARKGLGEVLIYSGCFEEAISELTLSQSRQTTWSNPRIRSASRLLGAWARLHAGRYEEAGEEANLLLHAARESQVEYDIGLTSLILGCVALAIGEPAVARDHLQESVSAFRAVGQRDELGWANAALAYVALFDRDTETAAEYLVQALDNVPEHRHYACALMTLPATALLFAQLGGEKRAIELHAMASEHAFVANSCWFDDVVGGRMQAVTMHVPSDWEAHAKSKGRELDFWKTMEEIAEELSALLL